MVPFSMRLPNGCMRTSELHTYVCDDGNKRMSSKALLILLRKRILARFLPSLKAFHIGLSGKHSHHDGFGWAILQKQRFEAFRRIILMFPYCNATFVFLRRFLPHFSLQKIVMIAKLLSTKSYFVLSNYDAGKPYIIVVRSTARFAFIAGHIFDVPNAPNFCSLRLCFARFFCFMFIFCCIFASSNGAVVVEEEVEFCLSRNE